MPQSGNTCLIIFVYIGEDKGYFINRPIAKKNKSQFIDLKPVSFIN